MRTQKSQRIQKLGIQVPHLLIQTQKRKKGNRLCWLQDSLKSKKSSGTSGYRGKGSPLVKLRDPPKKKEIRYDPASASLSCPAQPTH